MERDGLELRLPELAARTGVAPRTIRWYITKGLVPPPLRAGRDAAYGAAHVEALERIRAGQAAGQTLEQLRVELGGGPELGRAPEPVGWWEYGLAPDVRVWVRGETSGRRLKKVRDALASFDRALNGERDGKERTT